MTQELRQQLMETALAMNASGVNQGASGNLSVRVENGMLITPSAMDYAALSADDIVWMDFDGNTESLRKPSSEWQFHAAIYQQRDRHFITWLQLQVAEIFAVRITPLSVVVSSRKMSSRHCKIARHA